MKKFLKSTFKILVVVTPILISVISLYKSCGQDEKIDRLNSQNFQPTLKIVGDPEILNVKSDTVKITKEEIDNHFTNTNKSFKIAPKLEIQSRLKILNTGTDMGRILFILTTDTLPHVDYFRNYLRGKSDLPNKIGVHLSFFDDFMEIEILNNQDDTSFVEVNHTVSRYSDGDFNLHTFILYENEIGQIYDTYFRVLYKLKKFVVPIPDKIVDEHGIEHPFRYMDVIINRGDLIVIKKSKSSYNSYYMENELENIRQIINSHLGLNE